MSKRYAKVTGVRSRRELEAYLPENYRVAEDGEPGPFDDPGEFLIEGEDRLAWTLEGYVIPRLDSGLMPAREQFLHFEEVGDAESGPQLSTWLEDEPQEEASPR